MSQEFFSDKNKLLLHNLIKTKILELDNVDISNFPELKKNFESSLISVFRNGNHQSILEFNKQVLQECIHTLRQLIKPVHNSIDNSKVPSIDSLINNINNSQQVLDNIKTQDTDQVRNMYERTMNLRTPSKEKPKDIDFSKPLDVSLDVGDEYDKRMKERNSLTTFHAPPANKNQSQNTEINEIDKLINEINIDDSRQYITKPNIIQQSKPVIQQSKPVIQQSITKHVTINSISRSNIISSRYNYKVKLQKVLDKASTIVSIELLRLFIPIDSEKIFDFPILNIKIPELDDIIFKMSKVSEIETNNMNYAVYSPVIGRGYFPNSPVDIRDLPSMNIKFSDFFNYPILYSNIENLDIIKINKLEFEEDKLLLYIDLEKTTHILQNDNLQIKQIPISPDADIHFTFNNINHEIIETLETNNSRCLKINYPNTLLNKFKKTDINKIKRTHNFYLFHINLQHELLFKVCYNI